METALATGAELLKAAVTVESADKMKVHVPLPLQAPALPVPLLHPANVHPEAGAAVSVTLVPLSMFLAQLDEEPVVQLIAGLVFDVTVPVPPPKIVTLSVLCAVAALYGPTNGPPLPTGAVPAGWISIVLVSARARAMLTRPLPVWSCVP